MRTSVGRVISTAIVRRIIARDTTHTEARRNSGKPSHPREKIPRANTTSETRRLFTVESCSTRPKITFTVLIAFPIELPGSAENSIRITARGYNIGYSSRRVPLRRQAESRLILSVGFGASRSSSLSLYLSLFDPPPTPPTQHHRVALLRPYY